MTNIAPSAARWQQSGAATLDWVLAPVTTPEFFSGVYEHRVAHFGRTAPDYWSRLLTLAQLDEILGGHEIRHPEVRLVKSGETIAADDYSLDGLIDPLAVARLYSSGATVIFSHVQHRVHAVADFVNEVSRTFSAPVQANVYLTPAHAQGFPAHWDTHDVLILQLSGSKKWRIYDGGPALPLRGQHFERQVATIGPVTEEFEIRAGEAAYVPRGVIHSAHSTDEASLHVTVGILSYTWADLFIEAAADVALRDPRFRKSIRADGEAGSPADAARMAAEWQALSAAIDLRSSFANLRSDMLERQKPHFGNLLGQTDRAHAVQVGSTVRLRSGVLCNVTSTDDGRLQIEFCGNIIDFPAAATAALQAIFEAQPVRIDRLPGDLQDDEKIVLIRRLVREGLIEIVD